MSSSGNTDPPDLASMRAEYNAPHVSFTEDQLVSGEPMAQFSAWFSEAQRCPSIAEANAMCLSTATLEGRPSARFVLLKGFSAEADFCFYTNYESRKAAELDSNPRAALTFYWAPLHRSVRVEGSVCRMSAGDVDAYFSSRPYASQIGAGASRQSTPIANRSVLIEQADALRVAYPEPGPVPRPQHWGGYRLTAESVEFWQGQSDRLHDRIRFRRAINVAASEPHVHTGTDGWVYDRLAP